jgi:putative PIN family toxin of toxin-antitoxin system
MPRRPRVVADSNVIISAFHGAGNPRRVLQLANAGTFDFFYSPFIVEEVARIMGGPKFKWPAARLREAIEGLPGEIVVPAGRPLHVVADETDNRILECALAAKADFLVTGDHHLLDLGHYFRTRIVTPRAFLATL